MPSYESSENARVCFLKWYEQHRSRNNQARKETKHHEQEAAEKTDSGISQKLQRLNYHIPIIKRKHIIFKEIFKVGKCLKGAIYKNYQSSL